jgi:hypothetical protein
MLGPKHLDAESPPDVMRWLKNEAAVLSQAFLSPAGLHCASSWTSILGGDRGMIHSSAGFNEFDGGR